MRNDKIFVYYDYDYTIMIFIRLFNFKSDACVSDKVHVSRAQLPSKGKRCNYGLFVSLCNVLT